MFSFIWFLLLHKSLLIMHTLRRTGWVLVSQDPQHGTGPTSKNNPRKGTHGAALLWKKSIQLLSAVDTVTLKRSFITVGFLSQLRLLCLCTTVSSLSPTCLIRARWGSRGGDGRGCCMSSICLVLMASHVAAASGFGKFLKLAPFRYGIPVRGIAGWLCFMYSLG